VKQWLETRQVLDRVAALHASGMRAALATVVRVNGSAYRHEGAKLVVAEDESTIGNVSGGCLEADVREVALRVIESGVSERRSYCGGSDEISAWDLGVGCDGEVEILIEPVQSARDAERRAEMANACREFAEARFSQETVTENLKDRIGSTIRARHVQTATWEGQDETALLQNARR